MRVRSKSSVLGLDAGREFLVLGLTVNRDSMQFSDSILLQLDTGTGKVFFAPLSDFEIIDGRVSKHWLVKDVGSAIHMAPEVFHQAYFHDDLSEGEPLVNAKYQEVLSLLSIE